MFIKLPLKEIIIPLSMLNGFCYTLPASLNIFLFLLELFLLPLKVLIKLYSLCFISSRCYPLLLELALKLLNLNLLPALQDTLPQLNEIIRILLSWLYLSQLLDIKFLKGMGREPRCLFFSCDFHQRCGLNHIQVNWKIIVILFLFALCVL